MVGALRELGFALTETQIADIVRGKDFIQLKNGPFDLDLVFAPDGIEFFEEAWHRRVEVRKVSGCCTHPIIIHKKDANRPKKPESVSPPPAVRPIPASDKHRHTTPPILLFPPPL